MKYLFVAFCIMLIHPLDSQDLLTVSDAITFGLEGNFNVHIAQNDKRVAENNYTRANAGFLPVVTASGARSSTYQNVSQEFINGSTNEKNNATTSVWDAGIDVQWTIFDGLRMFRTYDRLGLLNDVAALDEEIAMENTMYDIALAYYDVVLQKSRVRALDTTLVLSQQRVDLAQTRYEVGKAPKLEFLSAQVDFNTDYSDHLLQVDQWTKAKHNLNNLMGREITTEFFVTPDIELDTTLMIDSLKSLALQRNTALRRLNRDNAVLDLEMDEIRAERFPSLSLNAGYGYNRLNSQAGFLLSNRTNGFTYGASLSWTLFDGLRVQRAYENNRIQRETNSEFIKQAELLVQRDLENAFLDYRNNIQLVRLEEQNLEVARESVSFALDRYKLGKSTFLELREAQVNAVQAYTRLFDALYAAKVAELQLQLLSGSLLNRGE